MFFSFVRQVNLHQTYSPYWQVKDSNHNTPRVWSKSVLAEWNKKKNILWSPFSISCAIQLLSILSFSCEHLSPLNKGVMVMIYMWSFANTSNKQQTACYLVSWFMDMFMSPAVQVFLYPTDLERRTRSMKLSPYCKVWYQQPSYQVLNESLYTLRKQANV